MSVQEKSAVVVWSGDGLDLEASLGSGYVFEMSGNADESAGSPMEFLLAGVAGCTAVDVINILKKKRQPVRGIRVEIVGARAAEIPNVYTDVEITYVIQGGDVKPSDVERAISLSKEKYCSASIMFDRAGTKLHATYRIEPD